MTATGTGVAPSISAQPASKSVSAGQAATFSVTATGSAPLGYQWRKNGAAISGATSSSYTTPATTTADNNSQFAVVVTNSAGTATSNSAMLVVNGTEILNSSVSSLSFGSVNVSTSGQQSVTLTNGGTGNILIANVSVSGAGFNASGVPAGTTLTPSQTATLKATFAPASAGSATGSITVTSNASAGAKVIALSGTGASGTYSVELSWTPSASAGIGYNVYVGTVSGGPYSKLTPSPVSADRYTDSGLQSAQTRYYVVTAVDAGYTESSYSNQVSADIP